MGDEEHPDDTWEFTGIQAFGRIDGRSFAMLIQTTEEFLNQSDETLEAFARSQIETITSPEMIIDYATQ